MKSKKLILVGILVSLFDFVPTLNAEPSSNLGELDPSPENYKAALAALQIKDRLVQTVYSVDPAKALVNVEQLEFIPGSGCFLILRGTAGTEVIRQLQAEQPVQGVALLPALAWVNGSCFAYYAGSGQWFGMSRSIPPSLSNFRILGKDSLTELSYFEKRLLTTLEEASKRDVDKSLILDTKKRLAELERQGRKEFSVGNERYSIDIASSGLVERLTIYQEGIVSKVIVNDTGDAISATLKKFLESDGDIISNLSAAESRLFQRLAGTPSFGMFLAPESGYYSIVSIDPRGPGYKAGLRRGDVVTALNGNAVSGMKPSDLKMVLSAADKINFSLMRDGKRMQDVTVIKKDYLIQQPQAESERKLNQ